MRRPRVLLAPAAISLTIAVISVTAVVGTSAPRSIAAPTPSASAAQLPSNGRVAYWRASLDDKLELWAEDLDGRRRVRLATVTKDVEPELTTWSPDGTAIAWARGATIFISRLDGSRATVSLPVELDAAHWRPVTLEWAPSGGRLAASIRSVYGYSNEGDVFVADVDRIATTWSRLTNTGDTFVGPWIDEDRLLAEIPGPAIAVLRAHPESSSPFAVARPITTMPSVSPRLLSDGRIHFFGGKWGGASGLSGPVAAGSVWSVSVDGGDLRRDSEAERNEGGRFQGVLPDGRPVVGLPGAFYVLGDGPVLFPWSGLIKRIATASDGRVFAITDSRVVQVDPAKIPRAGGPNAVPSDASHVILDGARSADIWLPSARTAVLTPSARVAPREMLTFALARTLWQLRPDGEMRPLVTAPPAGWVGLPVASPAADRPFVAVSVGASGADGTVVVIDRSGRWVTSLGSRVAMPSWSPDGRQLAIFTLTSDTFATQLYDTATWSPGLRFEIEAGTWSSAGLLLIDQGRPFEGAAGRGGRIGQNLDLLASAGRTRVTDADTLRGHPGVSDLASRPGVQVSLSSVRSGPRSKLALVSLTFAEPRGFIGGVQMLIRVPAGDVVAVIRTDQEGFGDATWSPTGNELGATRQPRGPQTGEPWPGAKAVVLDRDGKTVFERDGRFAGWSLDGTRIYVARATGLYEVTPQDGSEVLVSTLAPVPVLATAP